MKIADFAKAVGVSRAQVFRYMREDWWPSGDMDELHAELVRDAIAKHVAKPRRRRRKDGGETHKPGPSTPPPTRSAPTSAPSRLGRSGAGAGSGSGLSGRYDPTLIATLREGTDPLAMLKAAAATAAQTYADGLESKEGARAGDLADLNRVLKELRQAEAAQVALEEKRGELIPRAVMVQAVAVLVQRVARVVDDVQALLVGEVEMWLGDPAFQGRPTRERQQIVRDWYEQKTRDARELAAGELERVLEELRAG